MKTIAAFFLVMLCAAVAHADPLVSPDAPQSLAALWPMLAVAVANLAGLAIPRLANEASFFHSAKGKAVITVLGAFFSAVPSAIQAHGLCWAMLAWAALGTVGTLTSALSPKAVAKVGAMLLPLLLAIGASGCHGFKAPEYATLATMAGAAGIAAEQLPPICEGQENAAVDSAKTKDAAVALTGAIHHRCEMAIASLDGVGKGLKSARDAVHDAPVGADASAVLPWIKTLTRQYCDLVPLLADFKVTLPTFPGVC